MPASRSRSRSAAPRTVPPPTTYCCQGINASTGTYVFNVTAATNYGDALVIEILCNQNGSAVSNVTDSKGNVYTLLGSFTTNTPNRWAFYSPGNTGGPGGGATIPLTTSDTITITAAVKAMTTNIIAVAVSNVGAMDQKTSQGIQSSLSSSLSVTTTADHEILVSLAGWQNSGGAGNWSAPFTQGDQQVNNFSFSQAYVLDAGTAGSNTAQINTAVACNIGHSLYSFLPPPQITTASLPAGTVGQAYSAPLAASGGVPPPYAWAASNLPAGLALAPSSASLARQNTLEGGTNGTGITTGNSGGGSGDAFDYALAGVGATLNFDNSHTPGHMAALINTAATSAVCYVGWALSSVTQLWARFYIWRGTLETANTRIAACYATAPNSTQRAFARIASGGKLVACDSASAILWTSASALPLNQWVRVEFMLALSATVGQFNLSYYNIPDSTTPTESFTGTPTANLGGPANSILFGIPAAQANVPNTYLDDIAFSTAGPLGPNVGWPVDPAVISGTPSAAGTPTVGLTVTDGAGRTGTASLPLTVALAPVTGTGAFAAKKISLAGAGTASPPAVTGTGGVKAKKIGLAGSGSYVFPPFTGSGGVKAKKITLAGSGTFAAPGTGAGAFAAKKIKLAGTGTFTPLAITGTGGVNAKKIGLAGSGTFTVAAPLAITSPPLPDGTAGYPYTAVLKASGGLPPYTFGASGLPPGLGLAADTISGVPTTAGDYIAGVSVTDSAAGSASASYPVTIAPTPVAAPAAAPLTTDLIPVTLDGINLNAGDPGDGVFRLVTAVDGWYGTPPLNGNDLTRALSDGAIYGTKVIAQRLIAISGAAFCDDPDASRPALVGWARRLAALCADYEPVGLIISENYLDPEGDYLELAATVRADTDSLALAWVAPNAFTWQAVFTAADPRLYDSDWQSVTLTMGSGGATGRAYPWQPPRLYAAAQIPSAAYLANAGSVDAPAYVTYSGPFNSGSQLTDGTRSIYLGAILAGETVTVETETLTAYAPGGATRASYILAGSQPMMIPAGGITWHLFATGGGSVEINWRGAFA